MNQHPRAKELGLSPLKVSVGSWLTESNRNLYHLHDGEVPTWKAYVDAIHVEGQIKTEADVMADALNKMNEFGRTPSEMVEIIRELREVVDVARRDMWQTARVNQGNLTGADLCMPEDRPCLSRIGNHFVTQAGVDESLLVIRKIDEALTKTEDFR